MAMKNGNDGMMGEKIELHDMGTMPKEDEAQSSIASSGKKEKHYPSFSLSSKQLPELSGKKYGDKIELHLIGEIQGVREDHDDKAEAEYEIKIKEAGCFGKRIDEDEYKSMSDDEKDKADEKEVMGKE